MTFAIALITVGFIMVVSAEKGLSITDVFKGVKGQPLDPKGGFMGGIGGGDFTDPSTGTATGDLPHGTGAMHYDFRGPHPDVLQQLANVAVGNFHLTITSTFGGVHVHGSYHYAHRAFDASGSASDMAAFWQYVADHYSPTELFYDPKGAIKNGRSIPAVGGHRDHVHVAF